MPIATQRPCSHIGCPALTRDSYCPEHADDKKIEREANRKHIGPRIKNPIYATAQWKRLRLMVIRRDPVCVAEGCRNFSAEVDHIIPLSKGGSAFALENLQALCKSCHTRKTLSEQQKDRKEAERKR